MIPDLIWNDFFASGGRGMFPTSISGFLLLASALLLVLRPERRLVALVVSLALMTLGSGVLSTLVGIVSTFHYAAATPEARPFDVIVKGAADASHCLVLALLVLQATFGLMALAALRASRTRSQS